MKNRGFIIFLTVIITLLCIYYLSFTLVNRNIQQEANAYARTEAGVIEQTKKRAYLDSIRNVPVYNLLGINYTLEDINESKLNLGLDLQGGMHVVLEVSPVDIIRGLAGNSQDPDLQAALQRAQELQKTSQARFTQLFLDAWNEIAPDRELNDIFANARNQGRIEFNASNQEVIDVIREEVESAIERTFTILRTRIDQYGTTAPNIQRLQGTGRIQVEMPGADDPERVKRLLQRAAKLEFWEVYELQDIVQDLQSVNAMLVEEQQMNAPDFGIDESEEESLEEALREDVEQEGQGLMEEDENELSDLLQEDIDQTVLQESYPDSIDTLEENLATELAAEDTSSLDSMMNNQVSPLFGLIRSQAGLVYSVYDTATINDILQREDVRDILPRGTRFHWGKDIIDADGDQLVELYAIRGGSRTMEAPLTGEVITDARISYDEAGRPAISMTMNSTGAKTWSRLTEENIGRRIAIVLDELVYSAPVVQGKIPGGNSQISGNFTIEEAQDLSNILKAGSLPAKARIVEEEIVGPSLGQAAQSQGINSIVIGLALVVIFMVFYYAKGGLVANAALVFNIFFILGILAQLNAALTLPGIAGIVLTIGMSIDANVLIFERIREELRMGSSLLNAISRGYSKAFSSIIDANVTTFLTAVILFVFGQGPVRGFATTLMIGIASSFFSAVFITRVIVSFMTRKGDKSKISFSTGLTKSILTDTSFDFLGRRKIAYVVSSVVIGLGLILMVAEGGLNLGVDFTGGRSYVVSFQEPVTPSRIEVALEESFEGAGTEVKHFGANNVIKITTSYQVEDESEQADSLVRNTMLRSISQLMDLQYVQDDTNIDDTSFSISSSSKVGATIADDIKTASIEAIVIAMIVIFLYILIRFKKWQFSTGAIIAVIHDTLFVLAALAIAKLFGKSFEIDQVFIGAMLTIIGYSINDTVVVFDRIRENLELRPSSDLAKTFNMSINDTISRTLITSATTLFVVLILLVFGGEVLRGFSFALFIGILVGTYSSVFIASPVAVDLLVRSEARKEGTLEEKAQKSSIKSKQKST